MFEDKKVVVVIPVGREFHLKTLFNYLVKNKHIIDKLELWLCTEKPYDIFYIKKFQQKHQDWCEIIDLKEESGWKSHPSNYVKYYERCVDENTIYFKMDDDICWIDDGCFENMCKTLIINSETNFKLISANVINVSHTHEFFVNRNLVPKEKFSNFSYHESGQLALYLHNILLKAIRINRTDIFKTKNKYNGMRYVSINLICWEGTTMKKMLPFGKHDEGHFNYLGRKQAEVDWLLCGDALAGHFAYRPSFHYLTKISNLLHQYHEVSH